MLDLRGGSRILITNGQDQGVIDSNTYFAICMVPPFDPKIAPPIPPTPPRIIIYLKGGKGMQQHTTVCFTCSKHSSPLLI